MAPPVNRRPDAGVSVELHDPCPPPAPRPGSGTEPSITEPFRQLEPSLPPVEGLSGAARDALDRAHQLLTTDLSRLDVRVTRGEAQEALAILGGLSGADLHAALDELNRDGALESMLDALSPAERAAFLALASARGLIGREPGEAASGALGPPDFPALYQMDVQLPRCVNDAIHEHSRAEVEAYKRAFDGYVDRYVEAVSACSSEADIRALGRPATPINRSWELTDHRDPRAGSYAGDWNLSRAQASSLRAYRAVSDRLDQLGSARPEGTFFVEGRVDAHGGGLGAVVDLATGDPSRPTVVGSVTGVVGFGAGGSAEAPVGLTEAPAAGGVPVGVQGVFKTDGETASGRVKASVNGSSVAVSGALDKDGQLTGAGVSGNLPGGKGAGLSADTDSATVTLDLAGVRVDGVGATVGTYVTKRGENELSGGLRATVDVGPLGRAEVRVGGGAKGTTAETVRRALFEEGVFSEEP